MPSIPPGIPGGEKHIHHYLSPEPSCVSHMSAKHLGKNATSCENQGKWNRFFSKICSWITWEVTFSGNASPDHSVAKSTRLCRAAFADISSFGLYLLGPSYSKGMPGCQQHRHNQEATRSSSPRARRPESACQCRRLELLVRPLGRAGPLEQGMAAHSSIPAWESPWTEEPAGLRSTGSQRARHDWAQNRTHLPPDEPESTFSQDPRRCAHR